MSGKSSPTIACDLGAGDQAEQTARWRGLRESAELTRAATDDGIRSVFRGDRDTEAELLALVEVENECCSWARWTAARVDGTLVLGASSSGDGVEALQAMFAPATPSETSH
jgi:hypothetical protein